MRVALAATLVLLVLVCFWLEARQEHPQVDDAYISYRYARNLVAGHGLVYNVGEYVEGFTNLLWTLLIAAGMALGARPTDVAFGLGLASGTAALVATFAYAAAGVDDSRRWIGAVAPALLLAWIGFPVWTLSGLETPLFAAAVAVALAADAYGRLGLATIAALIAALTRPEGPLLAAVIFGVNAIESSRAQRRRVAAWVLAYAFSLATLTGFRMYYYGSPVPNTFFAKVGSNVWPHGVGELGSFVFGSTLPLLVPALWAVRRDPTCRVGALWAALLAAYIVWVGGDAFAHHRFWMPIYLVLAVLATRALVLQRETAASWVGELPLWLFVVAAAAWSMVSARAALVILVGLMVAAIVGVWGRGAQRMTSVGAAIGAILLAILLSAPWLDDAAFAQRVAIAARLAGNPAPPPRGSASRVLRMGSVLLGRDTSLRSRELRETLRARRDHLQRAEASARRVLERRRDGEPIELVAATAIGAFGYDVRLPLVDMLGLVDAHIARSPRHQPSRPVLWLAGHMRTDAEYVFARRPDYILLPRAWSAPMRLPVHDDMWTNPRLDADYEWDEEMKAYRRKALPRPG